VSRKFVAARVRRDRGDRPQPPPVDLHVVQQHIEEHATFLFLDSQLVVRTKLLLQAVVWNGAMPLDNETAVMGSSPEG
jgi:hypothetical protein